MKYQLLISFVAALLFSSMCFSQIKGIEDMNKWADGEIHPPEGLLVGKKMEAGDRIWSPTNSHYAIMQDDGNFCIYTKEKKWVWCNMTTVAGSYITLQKDGNLCVYNSNDKWVWDAKTHTISPKPIQLVLDDKGVLHLEDSSGKSVWTNK